MKNSISLLAALSILVFVALGCLPTSSTSVKGRVELDGKPVEGATVKFGPTLGEVTTVTGRDGRFELTAKHRFTAMLYLTVSKPGIGQREKIEFPGFAAPDEDIKVEMITIIGSTR